MESINQVQTQPFIYRRFKLTMIFTSLLICFSLIFYYVGTINYFHYISDNSELIEFSAIFTNIVPMGLSAVIRLTHPLASSYFLLLFCLVYHPPLPAEIKELWGACTGPVSRPRPPLPAHTCIVCLPRASGRVHEIQYQTAEREA